MLENPMHSATPPDPEPWNERTVDLKWALWSKDYGYWNEHAPGIWEWMREWYEASVDCGNPEGTDLVDAPRIVRLAPSKEIRYGTVEFTPGEAKVHFWAEWDNGKQFHVRATIETESFLQAMHDIDHCEAGMIIASDALGFTCEACGYPHPTSERHEVTQS